MRIPSPRSVVLRLEIGRNPHRDYGVSDVVARAPARASSFPLGHDLKHRARSRDRTPVRLSRPGRGYLFECPDSGQTRPKPPDVLNRPLKSCGFLRRHGGARPCLSRIVTTSTLAIPSGRLGTGRASFTGFRATAGGLEDARELHLQPGQRSGLPWVRLPAVSEAESDVSVAPGRLVVSQKGEKDA